MKFVLQPSLFAFAILCGSLRAVPALAQSNTDEARQTVGTGWIVTLGAGTEYSPSYEGAQHGSFSFIPSFDIRRVGEPAGYSAPDDNIDYSLIELGGLELGPVAGLRGSRSASDDSDLEGLHDIRWNVDAGAFAQYWPVEDRFRLRVEGRQGLEPGSGFVADFAADYFQPIGSRLVLSAGPRLSLADTGYMHDNFGITASESAASGDLAPFDAKGGVKSVGFVIGANYQFTDRMSVLVYDKFDRLVGDAADSPIVTSIGTPNQNTIGIVLSRSFQIDF